MQTIMQINYEMVLHVQKCEVWKKEDWSVPIGDDLNQLLTLTFLMPTDYANKARLHQWLDERKPVQVWQVADANSAMYGTGHARYWQEDGFLMHMVFDAGPHGFKPGVLTTKDMQEAKGSE